MTLGPRSTLWLICERADMNREQVPLPFSKRKKILTYTVFTVVLLGSSLALIEIGSLLYWRHITNPTRTEIIQSLKTAAHATGDAGSRELSPTDNVPEWIQRQVLHPYLGFVRNPGVDQNILHDARIPDKVNALGFFGRMPPTDRRDHVVSIAITGGSTATELFVYARHILSAELKKLPCFANKEIIIVSLALPGMKQPQQLLALNFLLSVGYTFDIVINLDGFNEAVLPFSENLPFGVFPFYPRSWMLYTTKLAPIDYAPAIYQIAKGRQSMERWRQFLSTSALRHSNMVLLLWRAYNSQMRNEIHLGEQKLRKLFRSRERLGTQEKGTPYAEQHTGQIYVDSAIVWRRASQQMWQLCHANGIKYFHYLQPNQYVPGSKRLSAWEKRHIYSGSNNPYRQGVEKGYPFFKSESKDLIKAGIPFMDMTAIFDNIEATLYKDNCCHYNQRGYEIVAREISRHIRVNTPACN